MSVPDTKTADFTVSPGYLIYECDPTNGPILVTLSQYPFLGQIHTFKDVTGAASPTHSVGIDGNGNLIDGAASVPNFIETGDGCGTVRFNGLGWDIIADFVNETSNPGGLPMAGNSVVIPVGGTAIQLVIGPCSGGYITNPPTAGSQGLATAENCNVDPVEAPGPTDNDGNGTTSILYPGQNFTIPRLSVGASVWGNAVSSDHKLTVVVFP